MPTRASYDRFAVDELIRYRDGVVRTAEWVLREIRGGARWVAEADAKRVLAAHHLLPALWNCDVYDEHGQWLACFDAVWLELGVVLDTS